jgi:hypothetical protein
MIIRMCLQLTLKNEYEQANHHHHPARTRRNDNTGADIRLENRRDGGKRRTD